MFSLSPTFRVNAVIVPAAGAGISIDALSDSTVNSDCSAVTVSPTLTSNSITATSLKSPMSGILMSMTDGAAAGAAAAGAGAGAAAATGADAGAAAAGAGAAASPAVSSNSTKEPSLILSPTATLSSFTTPAWLEGISIDALSDSTVISDCSTVTVSPGLTSNSITPTSAKSPMSGTLISVNAMFVSPFSHQA